MHFQSNLCSLNMIKEFKARSYGAALVCLMLLFWYWNCRRPDSDADAFHDVLLSEEADCYVSFDAALD